MAKAMKHYDALIDLGITNNPMGNLVTWGEGSRHNKDRLKAAGFRWSKHGFWIGPKATVANFSKAVKTVFGAVADTAGMRDAEKAEWV